MLQELAYLSRLNEGLVLELLECFLREKVCKVTFHPLFCFFYYLIDHGIAVDVFICSFINIHGILSVEVNLLAIGHEKVLFDALSKQLVLCINQIEFLVNLVGLFWQVVLLSEFDFNILQELTKVLTVFN